MDRIRKRVFAAGMVVLTGLYVLTGCQPAPEAVENGGVYHAKRTQKTSDDKFASDTVDEAAVKAAENGGSFDALIGTEENGIRICAELPETVSTVWILDIQMDDDGESPGLEDLIENGFEVERQGDLASGTVWTIKDDTATLDLGDKGSYCGKITESAERRCIPFSQVIKMLVSYLKSGILVGEATAKLTKVEMAYYPTTEEAGVRLTPAWHIYIPENDRMDAVNTGDAAWQRAFERGAAWNMYVDAMTGELLKVE